MAHVQFQTRHESNNTLDHSLCGQIFANQKAREEWALVAAEKIEKTKESIKKL